MRICLVAFQFWPSIGGSQTQAEKQARCLRQLGQEVLVVTLRHEKVWPAREECSGVPVIRVGGLYGSGGRLRVGRFGHLFVDLLFLLTLWRLRQRYDLLHTLQISPLAAVAALIGRLTRKPVIVGVQSTGPYELAGEFAQREIQAGVGIDAQGTASREEIVLQREPGGDLACLAQAVWGGRWMLERLRRSNVYYQVLSSRSYIYLIQYGFRPERIVYIPNGVDTQQFYPVAWRQEKGGERERVLLCVARLEYAKGVDILLHAWACMMSMPALWQEEIQPRLRLVGDGTCRKRLEEMAFALGVQKSVEFLGTRHDIANLLQTVWGFVLPSRWEGMPNALLEAMACGLPCIATRVSGSEDVIEQGVNGLLVEPERPDQLAYALRLLIEDSNLARKLGQNSYETIVSYYQLSTTVQGSLAFYRYLLSRRSIDGQKLRHYAAVLDSFPEEWRRYE